MSEVVFFAALAGLILLIFLLSVILSVIDHDITGGTSKPNNDRDTAENDAGYAGHEKPVAAIADAIHTYRHYRHADERHRAQREKVTIVVLSLTAVFALGALVAAISSNFIFVGQLDEMRETRVSTNRPWMTPPEIALDKLVFDNEQIQVTAAFTSKNIGHEPALGVSFYPELSIEHFNLDIQARRICESLRGSVIMLYGGAAFPNQPTTMNNINFGIPIKAIVDAREAEVAHIIAIMRDHGAPEADIKANAELIRNHSAIGALSIVGCVGYSFGNPPEIHGTGFVFSLQAKPGASGERPAIDISNPRSFRGEELEAIPYFLRGTFAD